VSTGFQLGQDAIGVNLALQPDPDQAVPFVQMAVVRLPRVRDISAFQRELLQKYRIEVPCIDWNGQHFIRISVQAYNTEEDLDALIAAVEELLPQDKA
jgi:selenocysteine lyase/cysteine desulfurase